MTRRLLLPTCALAISSMTSLALAAQMADVALIGAYSQIRSTDEHAYGYLLELWRDDSSVVGRWLRADGQDADFPTVMIQDLRWDQSTGAISFTAEWCSEIESFEGVLNGEQIIGTLINRNQLASAEDTRELRLTKRRDYPVTSMPKRQFQTMIDRLLRRSGPKC